MATATNESVYEKEASKAYRRFSSAAKSYHFAFRRPAVTCDAKPCMVFLGNHSSGKSSLINWILGEKVQDTGLAPTDDGFTVIMYGSERGEFRGQAALDRLPAEFREFAKYGEKFLHSLCVKLRPIAFLEKVSLIDSPGMIDSAEKTAGRDYDFEGVVRSLAELCDMVFYLFDPDKPGTTGETVNIFAKCLSGVKYKLHILLNKCDGFSGMYDFARTYGTLCWNLARVLDTKDMPKIWTIYSGETPSAASGGMDLADFNRHREEFRAVIDDGAARRRDNIVSQTSADFRGLSVRMRLVDAAWRKSAAWRLGALVAAAALSALPGALLYAFEGATAKTVAVGAAAAAIVLLSGVAAARLAARRARARFAERIDDAFRRAYRSELAIGTRDDLMQVWNEQRDETASVAGAAPLKLPLFGELLRWRLDRTNAKLNAIASR